jgi:hypothetical protein
MISHDPIIGDTAFQQINQPVVVNGQRAAGLRFGDPRVHALLAAAVICRLQPDGFANHHLRDHVAEFLGLEPDEIIPGRMTYDLRRLRLHGLIERTPNSHRYRPTPRGWQAAWFLTRAYNRFIRTGAPDIADPERSRRPIRNRRITQPQKQKLDSKVRLRRTETSSDGVRRLAAQVG